MNPHQYPSQSNVNWNDDNRRSNQYMDQSLRLQTYWPPQQDTSQSLQANDDAFGMPTRISSDRIHRGSMFPPDQLANHGQDESMSLAQSTFMNQAGGHTRRGHSLAIADNTLAQEGGYSGNTYLGQSYHDPSAPYPNGGHTLSASSDLNTLGSAVGDNSVDFPPLYTAPGANGSNLGAMMLGNHHHYGVPPSHHTSGVPSQHPNDLNGGGNAFGATFNMPPDMYHESVDFHRPVDARTLRVPVTAHTRLPLPTDTYTDELTMIYPHAMDQSDVAYGTAAPHGFGHSGTAHDLRGVTQPTSSAGGANRNNGERESSEAPSESSNVGRAANGRRRAGKGKPTGNKGKGKKESSCFPCQLAQVKCVKLPDNPELCMKCKKKYTSCQEGDRAETAKREAAKRSGAGPSS